MTTKQLLAFDAVMRSQSLSFPIVCALLVIAEHDDENGDLGLSQGELAKRCNVCSATVTRTRDVLENRGLIRSYTVTSDRRQLFSKLTEKGRELANKFRGMMQ